MSRLATILVFCLALTQLRAASPVLTLENELLPSPAGVGARDPTFIGQFNEGKMSLTWTAPGPSQRPRKYRAELDLKTHSWSKPECLFSDDDVPKKAQATSDPLYVFQSGHNAKVWFVSDKKDPGVYLSVSPDGGKRYLMPIRIEESRPIGLPDLVLLTDGTIFAVWPEQYNNDETALWLRRISPSGSLSVPVLLASMPSCHPAPRLTCVKDFDDKPAQFLLAYTIGQGETSQVATRLLTVDPTTSAIRRNPCATCPDSDEAARGYPLRGRVVSISLKHNTLTLHHNEITGVLPAGTTTFKVDPAVLKSATPDVELFARVEKRGADWWLYNASWVMRAQP